MLNVGHSEKAVARGRYNSARQSGPDQARTVQEQPYRRARSGGPHCRGNGPNGRRGLRRQRRRLRADGRRYHRYLYTQPNWSYCGKCRNLYYAPEGKELCAAGGTHSAASSTVYQVPDEQPTYNVASGSASLLQSPWLWCKNCSCLFWGPEEATSWCPIPNAIGTQAHDGSASGAYYLPNGLEQNGDAAWTGITSLQPGWRYCYNCKDLYWGGEWSNSICWYEVINGFSTNNDSNRWGHAPGGTVYYVFY